MTEQVIDILGRLENERKNYNDIKRKYVNTKKVQEKGYHLEVKLAYDINVRYENNIRCERYFISNDDIDVAEKVLDILLEHYTQLGIASKREIDRLVEELKNTSSDATNTGQGE